MDNINLEYLYKQILLERRPHGNTHLIPYLRRYLQLDPKHYDTRRLLASIYYDLREYDISLKHYILLAKYHPKDEFARVCLFTTNFKLALAGYKKLFKKVIKIYRVMNRLGFINTNFAPIVARCYFELDQLNEAEDVLQQAVNLEKSDPDLKLALSEILFLQKRDQDARSVLNDLLSQQARLPPDLPGQHMIILPGEVYKKTKLQPYNLERVKRYLREGFSEPSYIFGLR